MPLSATQNEASYSDIWLDTANLMGFNIVPCWKMAYMNVPMIELDFQHDI